MTSRLRFASIVGAAAAALLAGPVQATMIAGWDFSQYLGDGALTTDGATGATTLAANYSNLDPTFNAGAESAAFGTMYIDGSFGSTAVDPFAAPTFAPTAGSLESNLAAPVVGGGVNEFDSLTILAFEGQTFQNLLGMIALVPVTAVFEADLTSVPQIGGAWTLSFGAKTFSGTSVLGIEFSPDGVNWGDVGTVNLDTNDKPFDVALSAGATDTAFVRLTFDSANGAPIIDNLAINATIVPEPGTALLLMSGLAGLVRFGRRRA